MNAVTHIITPTNTLASRAMLATLAVHSWVAARADRKVSREVAERHNVDERRAGHYRKFAIDVAAPTYQAVKAAGNNISMRHRWHTLPWGQEGTRILTAKNFQKYSDEMRRLRGEFGTAVDAFIADYPRLKHLARGELNGLYDESDYPANIGEKFGVDLSIMPLPEAGDFRVALADTDVAAIRAGIEDEVQRSVSDAMREPYERLYAHIKRMVERLSDDKGVFRDSLVTGLADICEILPALNLTGDQQLEDLRGRAAQMIAGVDARMLREVPTVRESIARQAQEIEAQMAAYMGGAS